MSRIAVLVYAMTVAETLLYSALGPLLPSFEEQFGLSKAQVGLLVAAYPMGMIVAAVPVGLLASRAGAKRSSISGLLMLAATSVAFGLVDKYCALLATLFMQARQVRFAGRGACLAR